MKIWMNDSLFPKYQIQFKEYWRVGTPSIFRRYSLAGPYEKGLNPEEGIIRITYKNLFYLYSQPGAPHRD